MSNRPKALTWGVRVAQCAIPLGGEVAQATAPAPLQFVRCCTSKLSPPAAGVTRARISPQLPQDRRPVHINVLVRTPL